MSKQYSRKATGEQATPLFNLNESRLQAAIITGEENPVIDFRCVPERPDCKGAVLSYRGRLSSPALVAKLKDASTSGRAVFFTLNATDGEGVKRANVTEARAIPLDLDKSPLPDIWGGPEPSLVVQTSPGKHQAFWPIEPTADLEAVEDVARRAAARYGGDSAVCDAPHIFRTVGFPHWKTGKPFRSRIVSAVDPEDARGFGRYCVDDFKRLPPVKATANDDRPATDSDRLSAEDLKSLLDHTPVEAFAVDDDGGDSKWLKHCMAASAATGGDAEALGVYLEWCAQDSDYAGEDQQAEIENRWNSFDPDKPGGITAGTLYKLCRDHGVAFEVLQAAFRKESDFDDFDDEDADTDEDLIPLGKVEAATIPKTPWHIKGVLLASSAMCVVGPGSAGKSLFVLALACSIATGKQFGPWELQTGKRKVLMLSGEDDQNEMERRLVVVCAKMGIKRAELGDRLNVWRKFTDMVLVKRGPDGGVIKTKLWHKLRKKIIKHNIGFLSIDPFIRVHSGYEESNNEDMAQVVAALTELVHDRDCSLLIVHHTTKTGSPDDMNSARGGGAFIYACRGGNTFFPMSVEEWKDLRPTLPRFSYARVTSVKANYDAKGSIHWFELDKGPVGNGEERVGLTPRQFKAVASFSFESWEHQEAFLKMVEEGRPDGAGPWITSSKAKRATRLEPAMIERFKISEEVAQQVLLEATKKMYIHRVDVKTNRNDVEVWATVKS